MEPQRDVSIILQLWSVSVLVGASCGPVQPGADFVWFGLAGAQGRREMSIPGPKYGRLGSQDPSMGYTTPTGSFFFFFRILVLVAGASLGLAWGLPAARHAGSPHCPNNWINRQKYPLSLPTCTATPRDSWYFHGDCKRGGSAQGGGVSFVQHDVESCRQASLCQCVRPQSPLRELTRLRCY